MFSKFNKQINTIFLDPHSENFNTAESVNVILSPSLYWVKKVSLPIKYLRDVKPLLASLFEDTLPDGTYSYSAYKSGDDFFIFAYEDKVILDTFLSKGISSTQVKNVYFAQSELSNIDGAKKINETQSIYLKDDIVILLPCCWIEESGDLDLSEISLSKNNIRLKQFGHIVNDKALYRIAVIFIVFIVIIVIEYFITLQKISTTSELRNQLFIKYNLKSTMIQNRSILKGYKSIHDIQIKFREYTASILALKLQKHEKLSLLSLKGKSLIAEFSGIQQGSESIIEKVFKNKNIKYKSNFKKNTWHVEIEL